LDDDPGLHTAPVDVMRSVASSPTSNEFTRRRATTMLDQCCGLSAQHDIMVLFVYRLPRRAMHLPSQDNGHHPRPLPRPRWSKLIHLPCPDPHWNKSHPHVVQLTWSTMTVAQTNLGTSPFTSSATTTIIQPGTSRFTCMPRPLLKSTLKRVAFTCRSIHFASLHPVAQADLGASRLLASHHPVTQTNLGTSCLRMSLKSFSRPATTQSTRSVLSQFTWPVMTVALTHVRTSRTTNSLRLPRPLSLRTTLERVNSLGLLPPRSFSPSCNESHSCVAQFTCQPPASYLNQPWGESVHLPAMTTAQTHPRTSRLHVLLNSLHLP
jgi:hypothetical protein